MKGFLLLAAIAFGVMLLVAAGVGLSIWIGRRKTIGACSCDFDADKARARRGGAECCGGKCDHPSA